MSHSIITNRITYGIVRFEVIIVSLKTEFEARESILQVMAGEKSNEGTRQAPQKFRKIQGSNPREVRQQFLEHTMKASESALSNPSTNASGKLRPGGEVLNRLKFDSTYDMKDYVVGYIDRKSGFLEVGIDEWEIFGQGGLMAYIKNVKDEEIVWDEARKIDLVFGKKHD
jgi:uncharacterized protein (UPF0248 family)